MVTVFCVLIMLVPNILYNIKGHSLAVGSPARKGIKATVDGDAVAILKASGAIPIVITNTPELCLSWDCSNFITGTTNNPYNTNHTSGGSSGGEVSTVTKLPLRARIIVDLLAQKTLL